MSGHAKCVEVLIDYGANINAIDRMGKTPLHYAIALGSRFEIEFKMNYNLKVINLYEFQGEQKQLKF